METNFGTRFNTEARLGSYGHPWKNHLQHLQGHQDTDIKQIALAGSIVEVLINPGKIPTGFGVKVFY